MRNPNAKISAEIIAKMRKLIAYGLTAKVIASRFGIHEGSVKRALRLPT